MKKMWFIPIILAFIACKSSDEVLYPDDESLRPIPIFIISHGWHTGIALEEEHIRNRLPNDSQVPGGNYLMFEWGDEKYFPHEDPGTGLLLRAALLPTNSVIQITGMGSRPDFSFPYSTVVQVNATTEGVQILSEFIAKQFSKGPDNQLIFAENGLYTNSTFFKAEKLYFFPRTSNKWTAQALHKTGYPVSPFWAFTSGNVIKQAKKDGKVLN